MSAGAAGRDNGREWGRGRGELPKRERPRVLGPTVDDQTRCVHYRTELDVIAIRFVCCGEYYPCHRCHAEASEHPARPWPAGSDSERAVLCGACGNELTVREYRSSDACPACSARFNPACALHHPLYFA